MVAFFVTFLSQISSELSADLGWAQSSSVSSPHRAQPSPQSSPQFSAPHPQLRAQLSPFQLSSALPFSELSPVQLSSQSSTQFRAQPRALLRALSSAQSSPQSSAPPLPSSKLCSSAQLSSPWLLNLLEHFCCVFLVAFLFWFHLLWTFW